MLALGLAPLALHGGEITTQVLLGGLGLVGAGLGLSSAGLQADALEAAGAGDVGVASGVFSTSRYLGSIVGSDALAGFLGPAGDGVSGFGAIFPMAVGAALLSVPAGLALDERRG